MAFLAVKTSTLFSALSSDLFHRDWRLGLATITTAFIHIGLWVSIALQWHSIGGSGSDIIVLHYKVGVGPDLVGPWYEFFILPLLGLLILALNTVCARAWYPFSKQGACALAVTSCALQLAVFWAVKLIIRVNLF